MRKVPDITNEGLKELLMSFNNEENNNILQQQREFLVRLHQATLGELEKILDRIQTNISTPNILNSQFLQRIY